MSAFNYPIKPLLVQSIHDLSMHLGAHIDDSGGIFERCRSRVLESALMLKLLQQRKMHTATQASIIRFLHLQRNEHGKLTIERLLIDAALGEVTYWQDEIKDKVLAGFNHFTSSRKSVMFSTYLAILGALPYSTKIDPSLVEYQGYASWVGLTMCSIKVLNACGQGRRDLIGPFDEQFITEQLSRNSRREVWEGHFPAHLLALLSLHELKPDSELILIGIQNMLRYRNADGGLPFISDMTVFLTTLAGTALAKTSRDAAILKQMAAYIALLQAPDGGWAYTEGVKQTDVDDTCCAIECLRLVDPLTYSPIILRGEAYLTGMANPDGGFPTYCQGHTSEVTMTANAIIALAPEWNRHMKLLNKAVTFLLDTQQPDGSFERSWSLSTTYAIARVSAAMQQIPDQYTSQFSDRTNEMFERILRYLTEAQNPDGGWGHCVGDPSDVISTAHAMTTVVQLKSMTFFISGLEYLLEQQQADGGFTSIPDQAAPRPIPYDFPVLADIFVLKALGAAEHAINITDVVAAKI